MFDRLGRAGKRAFRRVQQAGGLEPDPDLAFYRTLKSEDFDRIAQQYGEEGLIQYITAMESKNVRGGA